MKIKLTLLSLAGMLAIATSAQAGPRFGISITTGGYYQPRQVYCAPRPVYCAPVIYRRPVVIYRPQVIYRNSNSGWNCGRNVVSRPIYRQARHHDSFGWRR